MSKRCDNKSVGMLVWQEGKLLLIERRKPPFGFAPPAGHVNGKGSYENAAGEELEEEVGLTLTKITLIAEGRKDNPCRREGGAWHYWKIFKVETKGKLKPSRNETKQVGWFSKKRIKVLAKRTKDYLSGKIDEQEWEDSPGIEPVWREWFKKLDII